MDKQVPISFGKALDIAQSISNTTRELAELENLQGFIRNGEPIEDNEVVTYVGFKNMTFIITTVILDGQVSSSINIKQDKGIAEMLREFVKDGRMDYDRSYYLGEIEVA